MKPAPATIRIHKSKGPAISKQRARTEATRRKLLEAAERIFAREGFEAARLEDIAASAGYTRGAFYANFESKEDIFLALIEQWIGGRIKEINSLLREQDTPTKRIRALREHYAQLAKNRNLALLSLEFKLFAIRHPEAHARLRVRQQKLRCCGGDILRGVMKDLGRSLPLSCTGAATGLGALSNALLLEHLVDSKTLPDGDTRHLLGLFFDAVIQGKTGGKPAK
ncbi:MAG TPA: TetR/AcrR family transcriptional regulator [Candidatus Acidoferrales bacterium]|jgi:AcrR family transcriptional regulator|nr:TetR/AcrR family transcriptional regulator [Candidatus Acidoferrales bacterium]